MRFIYFHILKGGRSSTATPKPRGFTSFNHMTQEQANSYEQSLLGENGKIARGAVTDYDIDFILDKGDAKLKEAFNRKYEKEKKNAEHVQRVYGKEWTNKDNEGNLYKIMDTPVDLEKPKYDAKQAEKIKPILKENL